MTAYLRKLKTKLQFSHRDSNNDGLFHDVNYVNGNSKVLTHSQWAHTILGSIIMGTILGYGQYYPVLNQMRYIFAIGLAIIVVCIFKALQSSDRWHSLSKLMVLVFVLVGLSYYQTDLRIIHFNSYTSYYLQQEGEYLCTVVAAPENVNLNGQEFYKYTIEIHGLHPYKNTAKNDYIKAQGRLQVYSKISTTNYPIRLGEYAIIEGIPKPLFLIEEEGRINLRGRYMSSNTRGRIYDGVYRAASNKDLQRFHYKDTFYDKLYRKVLLITGVLRESIDKNIGHNLEGPQKVLAQALALGGHYSELGEDQMKAFSYTGLIHILSISGSHIALLLALVYGLGRFIKLRKRTCLILGIIVACIYCGIVGGDAPVIRATMMSILMCIAYIKGRLYQAKQALCLCAILCVIYDPFSLFDVSFQLSFGATYGLLIWGKVLYERIQWLPRWIKTPLVLCVSAQLLILPLQLYYFHYLSLASLFAAIIITPLLDIAIVMLFGCTIISLLIPIGMVWNVIDWILTICLYVNAHLANSSICLWWIGTISATLGVLYYGCVGLLYINLVSLKLKFRTFTKGIVLMGIGIIAIAYSGILYRNETILHIIPMKQSNAFLIVKPYEKTAMVYIDTPDAIPMKASEIRVRNGLQSFGIPLKNAHVQRFQSTGKNTVLYKNDMSSVMVYNRQNGEKKLQLNDMRDTILITSQSYMVNQIVALHSNHPVLVSMPRGAMRDIDPDAEHVHLWGYQYIPDYRL